jgi:hypothetical protein
MNISTINCFMSGVAGLALLHSSAAAQSFSAEGILSHRSYIQGTPGEETRYKVTVHVKSPQWLVRVEALDGNGTNGPVSSYAAGQDGEAIYVVSSGSAIEDQPPVEWEGDSQMSAGYVSLNLSRSLPARIGATFICFTFVPNIRDAILTGDKGDCIWYDPVLSKHHVKLDVMTQIHPIQPLFEKTVVWLNDGKIRFEAENLKLMEKPWPPPYNKEYTNAVYTATLTNVYGTLIPLAATLTTFVPDLVADSGTGTLLKEESYSLQISRIIPDCQIAEFRPALPQMTLVTDLRWMDRDPRFHPARVVTNGGPWKVVSMAELADEYDAFLGQHHLRFSEALQTGHLNRVCRQIVVVTIVMLCILMGIVAKRRLS